MSMVMYTHLQQSKVTQDCSFSTMKENVVQRMLLSYLMESRRCGVHLLLFLYLPPMIGMPLKKGL